MARGEPGKSMRGGHSYITLFVCCILVGQAIATELQVQDTDLQDILDPVTLSVPPSSKWQPLRVRAAKTLLAVVERPLLSQDPNTKALSVDLRVERLTNKPVALSVVSGLYVVDPRGQVYLPLPDRFLIEEAQKVIKLRVIPISPISLPPSEPTFVGFVGGYNALLEDAFSHAWQLLFKDFPAAFNEMEQVNGHWTFRRRAPAKRLQIWLRWIRFEGTPKRPSRADLPIHFWQLLVWSIFEDYNAHDFASWLRATTSITTEYAVADAAELATGVNFLFDEHGVDASALGPSSFDFYYNQGVRAFRTRQLGRAEIFFLEAIKKDASQLDAHFNLGLTYYRRLDYESASAAWLVGTGLDNADASLFYHRGVALMRLEKPLRAAKMFRQALVRDPKHARAQAWLKKADPNNETKPAPKRRKKRRWRR